MIRHIVGSAILVALLCSMAPAPAAAQAGSPAIAVPPPGVTQELVLRDGSHAIGRVERVEGDRVVFTTTAGGVLEVDLAQIVSLKPIDGRIVNGAYFPVDPNPSRLFFGPTARSIPRGAGYVAVYEFLMPFVQVGITDRISIGGGTPLIFGGGSAHPFWITPKVQVLATKSTQAAVGVMHFLNVGDGNLGIAYGVVTRGHADTAVTVGVGYAYERSSGDVNGAAVGMIGGEHRVSRRLKLVTENYLFDGGGLSMFGIRFLGEHLAADLGLLVPIGAGEVVALPMVNFVWQFGRD